MSRRTFLAVLGTSAAGASLASLVGACGGGGTGPRPGDPLPGRIKGIVVDLQGNAQAVGRVYVLLGTGLNTGRFVDVGAGGKFEIAGLLPAEYQLRFWAPGVARVPEPNPNPVRVAVAADQPSIVEFRIERGSFTNMPVEIYAGDNFYQEQPLGLPNGETVVKLGTVVCWYNVGLHDHTVTGGPWGDSAAIERAEEFLWTADRVGLFGYRCTFHDPEMRATLRVTA